MLAPYLGHLGQTVSVLWARQPELLGALVEICLHQRLLGMFGNELSLSYHGRCGLQLQRGQRLDLGTNVNTFALRCLFSGDFELQLNFLLAREQLFVGTGGFLGLFKALPLAVPESHGTSVQIPVETEAGEVLLID